MIYGSGELSICANVDDFGSFSKVFIPPCYANFSFGVESQATESTYLNSRGVIQVSEAGITQERYLLTLTIEEVNFTAIQLGLGELSVFTSGLTVNEIENISSLTATVFTDSRIVASIENDILAYNNTEQSFMKKVTGTPANNNEYVVDSGTTSITFNASQLGQNIVIKIPNVNQTLGTIGGSTFTELFEYSFTGLFFTTSGDGPYTLDISQLRRISSPTFTADGNVSVMEIQFIAVCGNDSDNERRPFRLYSPTVGASLNDFCLLQEDGFDILLEDSSGCVLLEDTP